MLLLFGCQPIPPATVKTGPVFKHGVNASHWLSQVWDPARYGDASAFNESDVAWLAEQGFDHFRLPVDDQFLFDDQDVLRPEGIRPVDEALAWARRYGLGVVLDLHSAPGADHAGADEDQDIYGDSNLQQRASGHWRQLAKRYRGEGPYLRFELLNEPHGGSDEALNDLMALLLASVREVSPTRVVYLTANHWSSFGYAWAVRVVDDPYVAYTFHYYEPFVFTHQKSSWTEWGKAYPNVVHFPTTLTNMQDYLPADNWLVTTFNDKPLDRKMVQGDFARLAEWAQQAGGVEVYIGEFGVYEKAPAADALRWLATVSSAAEKHGFGWALWDYRGGFGLRRPEEATGDKLDALF